jgi:hypothetical protein
VVQSNHNEQAWAGIRDVTKRSFFGDGRESLSISG